jgi:outer membrane protein assembly factor BamB
MKRETTMVGWLRAMCCVLCAASAITAGEGNWPSWRGPHYDGSGDVTALPDALDPQRTQVWAVDLPGPGSGTPVVWGDQIFVSSLEAETQNLLALCYARSDGKQLWRHEVAVGYTSNRRNNLASPSPVCDATHVIFTYGSGDISAFDHAGKPLWHRNLQKDFGKFSVEWLYGSTPLLLDDRLFVQLLNRDDAKGNTEQTSSYLLAISAADGKDVWKHARVTDAKGESQESYSSPMPCTIKGKPALVLIGGDCATAHDAATGAEIWRFAGLNPGHAGNWRTIPSAVIADGRVVVSAGRGATLYAIPLDSAGTIAVDHAVWSASDLHTDVCVPLSYQGRLYVLDGDRKTITCVDPATGTKLWSGTLESTAVLRASLTAGDGKLFVQNEAGDAWVLAADHFAVLAKTSLGSDGASRSSIALAGGMVLVRTSSKLLAFAKK